MATSVSSAMAALDIAPRGVAPRRCLAVNTATGPLRLSNHRSARRLLARTLSRAPRAATRTTAPLRCVAVAAQQAAAVGTGPKTLYDKIVADHTVDESPDGTCLLYIDRHLVHEVTSPQAFEGLRTAGRTARRPDCTLATADHNVPTSDRSGFVDVGSFIKEVESRTQVRLAGRVVAGS